MAHSTCNKHRILYLYEAKCRYRTGMSPIIAAAQVVWKLTIIYLHTQALSLSRKQKIKKDWELQAPQMQKVREKKAKRQKRGSAPGIEPGTSSTLKTNHTPRPSGLSCKCEGSCFTSDGGQSKHCKVTLCFALILCVGSLFLCIWRAVTIYLFDGSSYDFVGDQGRGGRESTMIFYVGIS